MIDTPSFGLQAHLDRLAREQTARFALRAETREEFGEWQEALRRELMSVLCLDKHMQDAPHAPTAVRVQKMDERECEGYTCEKYALDVGEGVAAPMYVLVPKRKPPYRAMLAIHGHDPGVGYILGDYPDATTARAQRALDTNFAERFAQAGYLVCAVEQRGMGERLSDVTTNDPVARSCRALSFEYMMRGRTLLGERVSDAMRALDYLETRVDMIPGRIGCTGHSGGGTTALLLSALDTRPFVTLISGYFCSFAESILAMWHCECNYVPRLMELGEMGEVAALIAPRALGILNGESDPIFPIRGTRAQFQTVQRAYALAGEEERCELMVHPGEHRYEFEMAQAWFETVM